MNGQVVRSIDLTDVAKQDMRAALRDVRKLAIEMRGRYPDREFQRYATLLLEATKDYA